MNTAIAAIHSRQLALTDADKRALLKEAARQVNTAAQRYGANSPQHAVAKTMHADLCKRLGY